MSAPLYARYLENMLLLLFYIVISRLTLLVVVLIFVWPAISPTFDRFPMTRHQWPSVTIAFSILLQTFDAKGFGNSLSTPVSRIIPQLKQIRAPLYKNFRASPSYDDHSFTHSPPPPQRHLWRTANALNPSSSLLRQRKMIKGRYLYSSSSSSFTKDMAPSSSLISNIFSKPSWSFSSQPILQQHLSLSSSSKSTASMTPGDDSSSSNDNSTMNSSETEPNVVLNEGSLPISKSVVAVAEEETGSVGTTDFVNPDWESLSRAQRLKMAWRRFTDSPKFSALLLSVYVCVDIGVYYINGIASKEHTKQTVLLMQSMISFALGTSVAVARNHTAGVRQIFDVKSWISLFPIAASFAFSMGGQLAAFEHFSAPFVKILGQLKLPLSAVLSTIIIKKEYTFLQWQAISMVFSTVISFMVIKSGIPSAASGSLPGLIAIGIWVSFNCLATLLAERVYKANRNVPFYIAQAHMKAGELMTNLAILLLLPSFSMAHFFHGWNRSTIAVLLVLVADSWVSGLVVKRLSSVTKNMSKVASLLALYFLSLRNAAIVGSEILAAVTVVQATLLFVYASQPSQGATTSRGLWTRLYDDPKKENLEKSRGRVVQRLKINLENADSKTVKSLEKYLTNMGI